MLPGRGLVVDPDQHVTGLDVRGCRLSFRGPEGVGFLVQLRRRAVSVPPSSLICLGTVVRGLVVIGESRGEHFAVGVPLWFGCIRHRIPGVAAVPGHYQSHQLYPATISW